MDPLSVSASIIAIVQATIGVGKAVQYLRSIRNIPAEFLDLTNELTSLQAILAQVHVALVDIDGEKQATMLATSVDSVALQNYVYKKETSKEGSVHERTSKWRWTREREYMTTIRNRTRRTCNYLNLSFAALQTSRSAHQSRQLAAVHQAMQKFTQVYQEDNHQVYTKCLDLENLLRLANSENTPIGRGHSATRTTDTAEDIVSFPTLLTRVCPPDCACQCHLVTCARTPKWYQAALGTLFIKYNGMPLIFSYKCNRLDCSGRRSSLSLAYYFPRWFISRVIYAAVSWHGPLGLSASVFLGFPRVLSHEPPWGAIKMGNIDWIRSAISAKDILPNDVNRWGTSLVLAAIQKNRMDVADLLIRQGFDVELENQYNQSPVTWSCQKELLGWIPHDPRHRAIQRQLANLHEYSESSPIHDALLGVGSLTLATAISQDPGSISRSNSLGDAPLHLAIFRKDFSAVSNLLGLGANANIGNRSDGSTPLHIAAVFPASSTCVKIARVLLAHGADPNSYDKYGLNPLFYSMSNPEMTRLLLDHGAQPTLDIDGHKANVLTWVSGAYHQIPLGSEMRSLWEKSLEILVSAGIDLDIRRPGSYDGTPLLASVRNSNTALADVLIKLGASLDVVDENGDGVLHIAAMSADEELIQVLRRARIRGICSDAADNDGSTPLSLIAGRMIDPERIVRLAPNVRRPTQEEFYAFKDLLQEIRDRNRQLGISVYGDQQQRRGPALDGDRGSSEKSFPSFGGPGGRSSIGDFMENDSILGCWTNSEDMAESDEDQFFDAQSHWSSGEE